MTNTPGMFYAVAYWLSSLIIILVSPRKHHTMTILFQLLFLVALSVLMSISDGITQIFLPMMILYIAMILGNIYFQTRYHLKTAIYFTVITFILGEFIASLGWQILYNTHLITNLMVSYIVYMFVYIPIIALVIYYFESKFKAFNAVIRIHVHEMNATIAMGLAIFVMSNLSYVIGDSIFSTDTADEIFLVRTLFDFAGVAILYAYHFQLAQLQTRLELEKINQMLSMQYQNYEVLSHSMEVINQKYHDLKYQISVLKKEVNDVESLTHLTNMEREIKIFEANYQTGNHVLDTILTGKAIYCQRNDIEFMAVVDGKILKFISDFDLSTLFGNMLDNAIESVQKIKMKEQRLIHLLVAKEKQFIRIRLENCYQGDIIFNDDLPKTTKRNQHLHGYGLKSIQSIVQKYQGSMTINAQSNWFELRILLPIQ